MINDVREILNENGPVESGKLIALLAKKRGQKINSIKSYLSRNKANLESEHIKIASVILKNNSHVYYLDGQLVKLVKLLVKDEYIQIPTCRLLKALYASKFLLPTEVSKLLGLPIICPIKGHKYSFNCIQELINNNIIKISNRNLYNEYICFSDELMKIPEFRFEDNDLKRRVLNINIQNKLIEDFLEKLRLQNIIGWNTGNIYNPNDGSPIIPILSDNFPLLHSKESYYDLEKGHYNFYDHFVDAFGFSYLYGINSKTPIIINSLIYRRFSNYDLSALKSTMDSIKNINHKDFISILIYGNPMPKEIHSELKEMGVVLISVKELLNSDELLKLLNNKNETIEEKLNNAEETIKKLNGNSKNLKGALFNYAIALLFAQFGYKTDVNKIYNANHRYASDLPERECDVIAIKDDFTIIVELKAYDKDNHVKLGKTEYDEDSVKKFFVSTIKSVKEELKKTRPDALVFPVFITTSYFTDDAKKYMDNLNKSKKIVKIRKEKELIANFPDTIYYDRLKLLSLENKRFDSMQKLIKEEF